MKISTQEQLAKFAREWSDGFNSPFKIKATLGEQSVTPSAWTDGGRTGNTINLVLHGGNGLSNDEEDDDAAVIEAILMALTEHEHERINVKMAFRKAVRYLLDNENIG